MDKTRSLRHLLRQPRTWRIALTVALLVALGTLVDWVAVWHIATDANPSWLLVAAFLLVIGQLVITCRWLLVLKASGAGDWRDFGALMTVVSAGLGLGSFLPTSVGPDVARGLIFKTRPGGRDRGTGLVVASILIDRYAATIGTLLVAIAGSFLAGQGLLALGLAAVTLTIAGVTAALVVHSDRLMRVVTPGPLARLRPKIETLVSHIRRPGMLMRGLLPAIAVSVLVTAVRTFLVVSLYYAFGFAVPLALALFAVPVLLIALMAPVTIGGFGLREWVLIVTFAEAGSPPEVSVSVGLAVFFLQIVVSLPWVAMVLMPQRQPAPPREPAE